MIYSSVEDIDSKVGMNRHSLSTAAGVAGALGVWMCASAWASGFPQGWQWPVLLAASLAGAAAAVASSWRRAWHAALGEAAPRDGAFTAAACSAAGAALAAAVLGQTAWSTVAGASAGAALLREGVSRPFARVRRTPWDAVVGLLVFWPAFRLSAMPAAPLFARLEAAAQWGPFAAALAVVVAVFASGRRGLACGAAAALLAWPAAAWTVSRLPVEIRARPGDFRLFPSMPAAVAVPGEGSGGACGGRCVGLLASGVGTVFAGDRPGPWRAYSLAKGVPCDGREPADRMFRAAGAFRTCLAAADVRDLPDGTVAVTMADTRAQGRGAEECCLAASVATVRNGAWETRSSWSYGRVRLPAPLPPASAFAGPPVAFWATGPWREEGEPFTIDDVIASVAGQAPKSLPPDGSTPQDGADWVRKASSSPDADREVSDLARTSSTGLSDPYGAALAKAAALGGRDGDAAPILARSTDAERRLFALVLLQSLVTPEDAAAVRRRDAPQASLDPGAVRTMLPDLVAALDGRLSPAQRAVIMAVIRSAASPDTATAVLMGLSDASAAQTVIHAALPPLSAAQRAALAARLAGAGPEGSRAVSVLSGN